MSSMSTPPSMSARTCSSYAPHICSKLQGRQAGLAISCASVSDLEVGPMLPATHIFRGLPSAALRAIAAPSRAMSAALSSIPYAAWTRRLAPKVLVSIMSAPASM